MLQDNVACFQPGTRYTCAVSLMQYTAWLAFCDFHLRVRLFFSILTCHDSTHPSITVFVCRNEQIGVHTGSSANGPRAL